MEIVRGIYDAYAQRDNLTPFEFYAPDIEWDLTDGGEILGTAVYHGHAGVRASFRDILDAFPDLHYRLLDLTPIGDRVLVTVHEHGAGRESGVSVERRHYALWTLRDGMVIRMRVYLDRTEALRAVGLEE